MTDIANVEMAAAWDGPEGAHWTEHADRYEAAGRAQLIRLIDAADLVPTDAVLDIGCGTGKSTREAARRAGSVTGVDLSAQMLDRARSVAEREGLDNVTFLQADAQVHPFAAGAHDVVLSCFGAMFFADPKAAFTNLAQTLRSGGRLALLAWREFGRNEWLIAIRDALAIGRDMPTPPAGLPGPFGLADPDHTHAVLGSAGFTAVELTSIEEPFFLGTDADEAYAFLGTGGMTRGMTQDLSEEDRGRALAALHQTLADHQSADGVVFDSSAWLITART